VRAPDDSRCMQLRTDKDENFLTHEVYVECIYNNNLKNNAIILSHSETVTNLRVDVIGVD